MGQENDTDMGVFGFIVTSVLKSLHITHCLNGPRFAEVKCQPANLICLLASEDKGIYA